VLGFTLLVSLLAGIIFGLAPAAGAGREDLASELRERGSPLGGAAHRVNLRSLLVMGQVALSVLALTGAGLFIRSLVEAERMDPGFESQRLATMSLDVKPCGFSQGAGNQFYARVLHKVKSMPGVLDANLASNAPFANWWSRTISMDGQESGGPGTQALVDVVEPGYFRAVRTRLVRGREFTENDTDASTRVVVVNQTMARRFWPNGDPIGRHLHFFGENGEAEIVGVVRDSTYRQLGEPPQSMVYRCLRQSYSPAVTLYLQTSGDPAGVLNAARREVRKMDSSVLVSEMETMPQIIQEALWKPRLGALLFAAFGILAGLLTIVGVYGVISYSVGQRTREMGIRMALGAQAGDVVRQVLREGAVLVGWGLLAGFAATLALSRMLASLLLGISPRDPVTLGGVMALLLISAGVACYVPARRATRIHPMIALRDE
jgi:predicted permease